MPSPASSRRMLKVIKHKRTIGSLQSEMARKMNTLRHMAEEAQGNAFREARRLVLQTASRKNVNNRAKLFRWHAPVVVCMNKGKTLNPCEFWVKPGLAMTLKGNLIVEARSFPGNPYDGHPMLEQIEHSSILMQGLGTKAEVVYSDLGCRGVDQDNPHIGIKHHGNSKRLRDEERRLFKRQQVIEPITGHLEVNHFMDPFNLKGSEGDAVHAVLCAAGCNIRRLPRMFAKKGLSLLLYLLKATGLTSVITKLVEIIGSDQLKISEQRWALA